MSTAAYKQLGALLLHARGPLTLARPLYTLTPATPANIPLVPHPTYSATPKTPFLLLFPCSRPRSQAADLGAQLSAFLTEFKTLFSQLMQQTGTILTMLTAVLPRLTA